MKVTVKKYLNVRVGAPSVNAPCYQYLAPGSVLEVDGVLYKGDVFEDSDQWLKDAAGNYYWAGGVEQKENIVVAKSVKLLFDPIKMSWGLNSGDGINILTLWNDYNLYGQDVKVAVLDTGVNIAIPDIYDAIVDKEYDVKSFLPGESIEDDDGHGTRCASIVASRGYSMYGTAPLCNLVIGKIRSKKTPLSAENLLNALKWACEERNVDIVSMSFNTAAIDQSVQQYIYDAHYKRNKIFVASIGNAGKYAVAATYPANCDGCLSVGAYDKGRVICTISSWNSKLSFVAPGNELYGLNLQKKKEALPPATSYACPFAAGAIACLVSSYKIQSRDYKASQLYKDLQYDFVVTNQKIQFGNGILNPVKTIKSI